MMTRRLVAMPPISLIGGMSLQQRAFVPCGTACFPRTTSPLRQFKHINPSIYTRQTTIIAMAGENPNNQAENKQIRKQLSQDRLLIGVLCVGLTGAVIGGINLLSNPVESIGALDAWDGLDTGVEGLVLSGGDFLGAALWGGSLYFCSPYQQLLLFLGKIETERPSDWVLKLLGKAAQLDVDAVDYSAPLILRLATVVFFIFAGLAVATSFEAGLGDATWSVSTGIGSCFAAALYEVGRPERLSPEEAQRLELQWQDFSRFADDNLRKSGRCHESEVFKKFRGKVARYRNEQVLSDGRLRDMVRNWQPEVERSSNGYLKNVSVKPAEVGNTTV